MAIVTDPPILDPTGRLILGKLQDIYHNLHIPIGSGLRVNNVTKKIDVIPSIYTGLGAPEKELGKPGDMYVRYKWISEVGVPNYAADILGIYYKLPNGEIAEEDEHYNPWTQFETNISISNGEEEPVDGTGNEGDIYLMYRVIEDEEEGTTEIEITKLYQKIDGMWGYFQAGVPRQEFEVEVLKARYKVLLIYNSTAVSYSSETANTYKRYLVVDKDFAQNFRAPMEVNMDAQMLVTCDPYSSIYDSSSREDVLTILGDTKVKFTMVFDNNYEFLYHPEQVLTDGPNLVSFHFPIATIENQIHNLKIYLDVMNGRLDIAAREFIGTLNSTGLNDEGFSGVAVGSDVVTPFTFVGGSMFHTITEDIDDNDVTRHVPTAVDDSETVDSMSGLTFGRMFATITDSLTDIDIT